jgi:hypothetical protein
MNAWLDQAIVATLVITSAVFAAFRLGPAPMRLWMRRQWARLRGKPMPVVESGGCGDCANAAHLKTRGDNVREIGVRPRS